MSADDVSALIDKMSVADLLHRMAWLQDRREWDHLGSILADPIDVSYDGDTKPAPLSQTDLITNWRDSLEQVSNSQHILTGIVVDLDGDRAVARLNETVWLFDPGARGSALFSFGTFMHVTLRRTGGEWRIVELAVTPTWSDGNASVLHEWRPPA